MVETKDEIEARLATKQVVREVTLFAIYLALFLTAIFFIGIGQSFFR